MFELDFLEHKGTSKRSLSEEEGEFIQIAEREIQHCEDGHYELPIPLKNETIELPNNKTAEETVHGQKRSAILRTLRGIYEGVD